MMGCKWLVAAAQEYMEGRVHKESEVVPTKIPSALHTRRQLDGMAIPQPPTPPS